MAKWIKLSYMRGWLFMLKQVNKVLTAMQLSWHADWGLAMVAVIFVVIAFAFLVIALWFIAGVVTNILRGDLVYALLSAAKALLAALFARLWLRIAYMLLPLDKAAEVNNDDG